MSCFPLFKVNKNKVDVCVAFLFGHMVVFVLLYYLKLHGTDHSKSLVLAKNGRLDGPVW